MSSRFLIFTGDGKGKTTAALGMALRASGHGMRACVIQFVKSDTTTGEYIACLDLPGLDVTLAGLGFVPPAGHPEFAVHRRRAAEALELARAAVAGGAYDLVILDEILIAVQRGLLEEERVLAMAEARHPEVCLVMTGRGAGDRLIALADTVTEMRCIKHGFQAGVPAERGVEF